MKKIAISLSLIVAPLLAVAQYSGKVYVDTNRNGTFDKGEKSLSGVLVSDGLNVVESDDKGTFSLEGHEREKFIFITTPSGYKTFNKYYQPISSETESYDFGVYEFSNPIAKDGSHKFIQISDTEIRSYEEHDEWVQNIRDYAKELQPAFVIQTGDICYPSGMQSHIRLMNTENMNTSMFYCIGNHDLVAGDYGEQMFESIYGPVFYSFDVGSVHYIVTPMLSGDYKPSYTKEDVYRWMKNDLKFVPKDKAVIVFSHDLLTHGDDFIYSISDTEYIDLDAHNLKAWLYGHWHINTMYKHKSAYSICTSTLIRGGIDHASAGYRVLNIDSEGDIESEFRYSYLNKALEIASLDNLHAATSANGVIPISVNTYSATTATESVTYNCEFEGETIIKEQPLKQNTDFNWSADMRLPDQYDGAFVTVSVTSKFKNGEVAKRDHSFVYHKERAGVVDASTEWSNLLGSAQHYGVYNDTLKTPLKLSWVNNIGSNIYMCSPVISDGVVYVASIDEDCKGKAAVVAMDATSGAIKWKYSVEGSIKNSIAVESGNVFAQDIYGNLYAIDCKSGELKWSKKMSWGAAPALNAGLIAEDGVVYAGLGKALCAVDALSGETIWEDGQWGAGEGCAVTLTLCDGVVIGGAHWGAMYGNDAKTGKKLWGNSADGLRNRSASPVAIDGLLYVISKTGFFIIDPQSGNVITHKELGRNVDVASTPLVTESEIIFGTAEEGVLALDRKTLEEKWAFETAPSLIFSSPYVAKPASSVETSPVLSGDVVYVAASDGVVYGINRKDGSLVWKHATGAPCFGSVSISGNALFAVDFSGNTYCFGSF